MHERSAAFARLATRAFHAACDDARAAFAATAREVRAASDAARRRRALDLASALRAAAASALPPAPSRDVLALRHLARERRDAGELVAAAETAARADEASARHLAERRDALHRDAARRLRDAERTFVADAARLAERIEALERTVLARRARDARALANRLKREPPRFAAEGGAVETAERGAPTPSRRRRRDAGDGDRRSSNGGILRSSPSDPHSTEEEDALIIRAANDLARSASAPTRRAASDAAAALAAFAAAADANAERALASATSSRSRSRAANMNAAADEPTNRRRIARPREDRRFRDGARGGGRADAFSFSRDGSRPARRRETKENAASPSDAAEAAAFNARRRLRVRDPNRHPPTAALDPNANANPNPNANPNANRARARNRAAVDWVDDRDEATGLVREEFFASVGVPVGVPRAAAPSNATRRATPRATPFRRPRSASSRVDAKGDPPAFGRDAFAVPSWFRVGSRGEGGGEGGGGSPRDAREYCVERGITERFDEAAETGGGVIISPRASPPRRATGAGAGARPGGGASPGRDAGGSGRAGATREGDPDPDPGVVRVGRTRGAGTRLPGPPPDVPGVDPRPSLSKTIHLARLATNAETIRGARRLAERGRGRVTGGR